MYNRAERFKTDTVERSFVSPAWYHVDYGQSMASYKQNQAPFLVSAEQITDHTNYDLRISSADYYPLYRKHRITLGNSLQYTETRDIVPPPCSSRCAKKMNRSKQRICFTNNQDFTDIFTKNFAEERYCCDDEEHDKKYQNRHLLARKIKQNISNKTFPRHQLKNLIRIKSGPEEQTANVVPQQLPVPKVKKLKIRDKDPGPGPGSYNFPSLFDRKLSCELCASQMKPKQHSHPRFLDSLIKNALREKIPGPGQYKEPKSSFDIVANPLNGFYRPHFSRKKMDIQLVAPNYYDVKFKYVEPSKPEWSMKGSKRNTIPSINSFPAGPSTYNIKNGNIGYKIDLRTHTDRRLMVTKQPFDSTSRRVVCEAIVPVIPIWNRETNAPGEHCKKINNYC